jgi:hypothetical protein
VKGLSDGGYTKQTRKRVDKDTTGSLMGGYGRIQKALSDDNPSWWKCQWIMKNTLYDKT